jgi:hypothetical protein
MKLSEEQVLELLEKEIAKVDSSIDDSEIREFSEQYPEHIEKIAEIGKIKDLDWIITLVREED